MIAELVEIRLCIIADGYVAESFESEEILRLVQLDWEKARRWKKGAGVRTALGDLLKECDL